MIKISGSTFIFKIFFPIIWIGIVFSILITSQEYEFLKNIGIAIFILILGFFFFKFSAWDLADSVYDNGDFLLFKKGKKEQQVNIKDIISINNAIGGFPERITIYSSINGDIGKKLVFSPPLRLKYFYQSPVIKELINRIENAKNT